MENLCLKKWEYLRIFSWSGNDGGSFCEVEITADLFGAIWGSFFHCYYLVYLFYDHFAFAFLGLNLSYKGRNYNPNIHQTTHESQHKTFTSHKSKTSQNAPKIFAVISTARKVHYFHFKKRFAIIAWSSRMRIFIECISSKRKMCWSVPCQSR